MRISGEPPPLQVMIDQKQLETVECFCLDSMIRYDAKCTHEIKSRIAMTKSGLNRKDTFHKQIGLISKEETKWFVGGRE
jgi:hypothetical protein